MSSRETSGRTIIELVHAAAWLLGQAHYGVRKPMMDGKITDFDKDIKHGQVVERWSHDDDAPTFDVLNRLMVLEPLPEHNSHECRIYRFRLDQPTLRDQLEADDRMETIETEDAVAAFISQAFSAMPASLYGKAIEHSEEWASFGPLPRDGRSFSVPAFLSPALDAMVAEGYAGMDGGRYRWLPKLVPIMRRWEWISDWQGL